MKCPRCGSEKFERVGVLYACYICGLILTLPPLEDKRQEARKAE